MEDEHLFELYSLGFNTLKALCVELRLEKEWKQSIKQQYSGALSNCDLDASSKSVIINPEDTIKLLTRCKKMYDAKTSIQHLLKLIVERSQMVEYVHVLIRVSDETSQDSQQKAKKSIDTIDRLSTRISSQINTLQEEHRIFKRPFIVRGTELVEQMQIEGAKLEKTCANKFNINELRSAESKR